MVRQNIRCLYRTKRAFSYRTSTNGEVV